MPSTETTVPAPSWDTTSTPTPLAAPPPPPATAPPRRRGWWGWLVLALLIGGLAFIKIKYFPSPAGKEGGKGAAGKGGAGRGGAPGKGGPQRTPVGVYVVRAERLTDDVAATGSVLAEEATVIRSELPGRITSLHFREGQRVRKGQLLFTINADENQAALQKQRYNIQLYQDQERRQRTLLAKEYISQQEYEQANNQLLTARAEQQALQATLAKAQVRAPFGGVLGLSTTTVGSYVTPGTAIVALARTRPVKIDFAVPGRFAAQVRVGDVVRLTDEAGARQYEARVYALDPQLDPVSRTLHARARYPNLRDELLPGAFVKVNLELGATADALQIPTEAVVPVASGYQVFVVKNGRADVRDVKIGARSDRLIQILSGLAVGDSVVRTGVLQIKKGDGVLINN